MLGLKPISEQETKLLENLIIHRMTKRIAYLDAFPEAHEYPTPGYVLTRANKLLSQKRMQIYKKEMEDALRKNMIEKASWSHEKAVESLVFFLETVREDTERLVEGYQSEFADVTEQLEQAYENEDQKSIEKLEEKLARLRRSKYLSPVMLQTANSTVETLNKLCGFYNKTEEIQSNVTVRFNGFNSVDGNEETF